MNEKLLKAKMVEHDLTIGDLANLLGLRRETVGIKIRTDGFRVCEARAICQALNLTSDELCEIFFA